MVALARLSSDLYDNRAITVNKCNHPRTALTTRDIDTRHTVTRRRDSRHMDKQHIASRHIDARRINIENMNPTYTKSHHTVIKSQNIKIQHINKQIHRVKSRGLKQNAGYSSSSSSFSSNSSTVSNDERLSCDTLGSLSRCCVSPSVRQQRCYITLLLLLLCQLTCEAYIREDNPSPLQQHKSSWTRTPRPPLRPQFDSSESGNVTALAGKTALLNCRVHNAENLAVSWVRHRDIHLLATGKYTYTSDQRFRVVHDRDSDDYALKIAFVQPRDSGVYECQVSTTPPMSHFIRLNIVEPHTTILGGPDMHINRGSTINLTCVIQFSPQPPDYILWNHNNRIIGYDSPRGGVTVIIEKGDETICTLLVQHAGDDDSGRYVCTPSNAAPANITVHVLNGEHPAAVQHGGNANYRSFSTKTLMLLLLLLFSQYKHNLH